MNYNQGVNNPMFGKKHSKSTKNKMSKSQSSHLNHMWKGNNVQYAALHDWVRRNYGRPTTCEDCGTKNLHGAKINWANKSGKYLRSRSDWKRLCVKCHRKISKGSHTIHNGNSRNRVIKRLKEV